MSVKLSSTSNETKSNLVEIALKSETPAIKSSTSFYGRRFKALRAGGDILLSLIKSLFYKIISITKGLIHRSVAQEFYGELAWYHFNRSGNRLGAYIDSGNKVINFAFNSTGRPKTTDKDRMESEQLKEIYGNKLEEMRKLASSEQFPIQVENLSRCSIKDGICNGASLDFIGRFLKLHQKNGLWFENIEQVSGLFTEGGTHEAQITQILFQGQDLPNDSQLDSLMEEAKQRHLKMLEKRMREDIKKLQDQHENSLSKIKEEAKTANQMSDKSPESKEKITRNSQAALKNAEQDLLKEKDKFEEKYAFNKEEFIESNIAEAKLIRQRPLAALHNLQLDLSPVIAYEKIKQKLPPKQFVECLEQLPDGAYYISLSPQKKEIGHASVFIKESNTKAYLYDPNYATILLEGKEEQSQKLWSLMKSYNSTLTLFKANLAK